MPCLLKRCDMGNSVVFGFLYPASIRFMIKGHICFQTANVHHMSGAVVQPEIITHIFGDSGDVDTFRLYRLHFNHFFIE